MLAGRRGTLDARVTGAALGEVTLAFEATPPRDPLDLAAWQRLDRSAIDNAELTARRVALAGVAGAAGSASPAGGAAPLAGTIDGAINLAPGKLGGELRARGVALPFAALSPPT